MFGDPIFNLYDHAKELIARKNFPKALENYKVLKSLLEKCIEGSNNPDKSNIVRTLRIYEEEIRKSLESFGFVL